LLDKVVSVMVDHVAPILFRSQILRPISRSDHRQCNPQPAEPIAVLEERDCRPIMPLRQTPAVKAGAHKPPTCDHGEWRFAGSDYSRKASKWRCPTGECKPASRWVKADRLHPLVPRETPRWRKLYEGRAAVEREFGRLKNEWALLPSACEGSSGFGSMLT